MSPKRRRLVFGGLALGGVALSAVVAQHSGEVFNTCRALLPPTPAVDELIRWAWESRPAAIPRLPRASGRHRRLG